MGIKLADFVRTKAMHALPTKKLSYTLKDKRSKIDFWPDDWFLEDSS
jgi:hypothetical protein